MGRNEGGSSNAGGEAGAFVGAPLFRPERTGWRDPYVQLAGWIFLFIIVSLWSSDVDPHEMIYLLGSRRLADPSFLAHDFTWAHLPPTSWLFDHLIAPLWRVFDEFTIANIGRFTFWALFATSIAALARTIRLPAWSAFTGFALWVLWRQTLLTCGSPLEGFQVKAFSYPLLFFALRFAILGRLGWAGACAGLGTAFHIVIGGWGFLGILITLVVSRLFTFRQMFTYLLAAAPFMGPALVYVLSFHAGHVTHAEQKLMDQIYVRFAMPHCCDFTYFMYPARWVRAAFVFTLAPLMLFTWPEKRAGRFLAVFVLALVAFFMAGPVAQALDLDSILKLYPTQLANSIPALLTFMLVPAWLRLRWPPRLDLRTALATVVTGLTLWLVINREVPDVLIRTPFRFVYQITRPKMPVPLPLEPLYRWVRTQTPRDAVFITPLLTGFWTYGERAQVATMRHPPLDKRLIEWKERLEAINRFRPYKERADDIYLEQDISLRHITVDELIRIREKYGASYLLLLGHRKDLAERPLFSYQGYSVYDIRGLKPTH